MTASMRAIFCVLIIAVCWPGMLDADEPRTFYRKTADEWVAVLRNGSSTLDEQRLAIHALAAFGPEAKAAVPCLVEALNQQTTREAATDALTWIGAATDRTVPLLIERFRRQGCVHLTGAGAIGYSNAIRDALVRIGEPAVPGLIGLLKGQDRDMRVCAADALAQLGPAARAAIPGLIDAIDHPEPTDVARTLVRHSVRALGRIGPEAKDAVPALTRLFDEGAFDELEVVKALDRIGAPPVRKLLRKFLDSGDTCAADELALLGANAREAIPGLRQALRDKRPQVRFSAAMTLASVEATSVEPMPVLIEALDRLADPELDLRELPSVLGRLGPHARAAVSKLAELAAGARPDSAVLVPLAQIDAEGKQSIAALISALGCGDIEIVETAAHALGLLGPRAKAAVPALTRVLCREFQQDEGITDYNPPASAAKALRRIGPQARAAVPFLANALSGDDATAAAAAETLGSFREAAASAVPALIETLHNRKEEDASLTVRAAAILAVGQIGLEARAAVPVLRKLLKDNEAGGYYAPAILVALIHLDPDGKPLAEQWLDRDTRHGWFASPMYLARSQRAMVLGALGRTSFECDWAIRRHLDALDSQFSAVPELSGPDVPMFMEEWFESLGVCGPAARAAIPRLNKYLNHPSPFVRLWAAEAIQKIASPGRGLGGAERRH